jgi:hypothetical protein
VNQCASSDTECEYEDDENAFAQVMTFAETSIAGHVCDAEVKENKCAEKRCGQYANNTKKC